MIAPQKRVPEKQSDNDWQEGFLTMLPAIRLHAHIAFRQLDDDAKEEAVAETIANAAVAYARLYEQGRVDVAFRSVLTRYSVAQVHDGRKVGNRLNSRDVLSPRAQRRHGFAVKRLESVERNTGAWIEAVIEDPKTSVPDQVSFRCDLPAWLATLSRRNRRIAEALAMGHTTGEVSRRFKVSQGRVSQLRRELRNSWLEFHGELASVAALSRP